MIDDLQLTSIQSQFLKNNEIHILGEVGEETADYVHACMLYLKSVDNPDISIYLRSEGGSIDAGLQIYDEIRHYKGSTTGIVRGYAHSIATVILQACTTRCAMRHSSLLVHNVRLRMMVGDRDFSEKEVRRYRKEIRAYRRRIDAILIPRTGQSVEKIRAQCDRAESLSAEEALQFGLIDAILM
jgi:ATP-dependent Clp protease, protease subunit